MSRRWTEERIRRELEASSRPSTPGHVPRQRPARAVGRDPRPRRRRFAEEYGLPYTANARRPVDDEIRARLRSALRGAGVVAWPSRAWLQEHVGHDVVLAIDRSGGRWARELGLPLWHRHGHRWTPETIAAALERLWRAARRGRAGASSKRPGSAVCTAGSAEGHGAMAARYRLALQRPRRQRATPPRAGGVERAARG